jgi:DNA-directed RNA polymerase delta subunit
MTWASIEGIGKREEELLSRVSLDGDHEQIKSMQHARRQSAKKKGVTFNSDVKEDGLNTDRPLNEPEKIADEENQKDDAGPDLIQAPSAAHGVSKTNMTIDLNLIKEAKPTHIKIEEGAER